MIIVLRGVSGSGKSEFSSWFPPELVLSFDNLRKVVSNSLHMNSTADAFEILHSILAKRSQQKLLSVVDATNLRMKYIRAYKKIAEENNIPCYVISINTDYDKALAAVSHRVLRGGHDVAPCAIKKQMEKYISGTPAIKEEFKDKFVEFSCTDRHSSIFEFVHNKYKEKFYVNIPKGESLWFIGDVHACYEELEAMAIRIMTRDTELGIRKSNIWIAGDIIDRGPSLKKTWEVFKKYGMNSVPGNHETSFLNELKGAECRSRSRRETHAEFQTLSKKLREEFVSYFENQSHYKIFNFEESRSYSILSHGGMDNEMLYNSMRPNYLIPPRMVVIGSNCVAQPDYDVVFQGDKVIQAHGHFSWYFKGPEEESKRNTVNLDSGCVYGDGLMAFNPLTRDYIHIPSKKWYAHERPSRTS